MAIFIHFLWSPWRAPRRQHHVPSQRSHTPQPGVRKEIPWDFSFTLIYHIRTSQDTEAPWSTSWSTSLPSLLSKHGRQHGCIRREAINLWPCLLEKHFDLPQCRSHVSTCSKIPKSVLACACSSCYSCYIVLPYLCQVFQGSQGEGDFRS